MKLSKRAKIIIGVGVIAVIAVVVPLSAFMVMNANSVQFQLLYNAGVKIEAYGLRIYVDPYNLPESFEALPADVVLITHPHFDHYQNTSIDLLQKEGTVNVFPENMSDAIAFYEGVGVNPGDEIEFGSIHVTAFYAYYPVVDSIPSVHPRENNWTSYIIDVGGFNIFHAGDSRNIEEYSQLTGTIDVALLCIDCNSGDQVVESLEVIQPRYFVPIHYTELSRQVFFVNYAASITNCIIVNLEYYQPYAFPR
ncbi:MAG: MBL fold metallo-hydrolase [Candidatus Hermodarchaeota archaeon]|nr:MBL fold metallo-hydrolase [Candidatus Hermodarchaeota archaeon]